MALVPKDKPKDPLFGAAVLKVTLLRRGGVQGALGELYEGVLADLGVTDAQVERFLQQHRADIERAIAEKSAAR